MKKILVVLFFLILVISASGEIVQTYNFYTEDDNPGTDVSVVWYACANAACSQVVSDPTSNLFTPNPKNQGSSTSITFTYPNCMETQHGYLIRLFKENYRSIHDKPTSWSCISGTFPVSADITFDRKDNCKADISLGTIQNQIGEWLPLTIDTTTNLDTNTQSAFSPSGYYFPPEFNDWINISTKVTIQIRNRDTNQLVDELEQTKGILSGTSIDYQFSWNPSAPGNYTVKAISEVVDSKCDLTNDIISETPIQEVEVFPELPDEVCVIVADPLQFSPTPVLRAHNTNIDIGSYYYYLDKQYKGEYENLQQDDPNWYDLYLIYEPITADYTITYNHQSETVVENGTFPRAWTGTRINTQPEYSTNTPSAISVSASAISKGTFVISPVVTRIITTRRIIAPIIPNGPIIFHTGYFVKVVREKAASPG